MCPGAASSGDGVAVPVPQGREVGGQVLGRAAGQLQGCSSRGSAEHPLPPLFVLRCCRPGPSPWGTSRTGRQVTRERFCRCVRLPGLTLRTLCVIHHFVAMQGPEQKERGWQKADKGRRCFLSSCIPREPQARGLGVWMPGACWSSCRQHSSPGEYNIPRIPGAWPWLGEIAARSIPRGCSSATR